MTTLKLEAEVQLMIRERAFLMSRALPGEDIEMEARLGVKPGASGTSGLFWINAYRLVRSIRGIRRTWANYTHTVVSDPVVSFRRRDGVWSLKKEIRSVQLSNHWTKLSLSTEAFSHEPTKTEIYKEVTRHIARHSFYIGQARVDFTKSYTDGNLTFEVEVEYLAPAKGAAMAPYIDLIYSITAAMFQTPLPFTYEMLLTVSAISNALLGRGYEDKDIAAAQYLNRNYLSDAGPLDISHLNYSTFFRGGNLTWTVCLKTDYKRLTLVICDQGTWLLFPPLQAALYCKNDAHSNTRLTIADGEFDEARKELWILDALWIDGTDVRGDEKHLVRYEKFRSWQEKVASPSLFENLTVRYKKHNILSWNDFFSGVHDMWESRHGAGYKVDGLIFTPDLSYQHGTDPSNRVILKWKPEITIDLLVNKDTRGNLIVLGSRDDSTVSGGRGEEQFRGNESSRLLGIDMGEVQYNRGAVVEFACRDRKLVALHERSEKMGPNRIDHALDSWLKATVDTLRVDTDTLMGRNNVLMRKYHNRIKDSLFRRAAATSKEGLVLLDIGSGRGGDLSKMRKHKFSKMILVEPNPENATKLKERLKDMEPEFQSRVLVLQAKGEDAAQIKLFATDHGITKVDVVSMMDSLTYFFKPGSRSLSLLARTVNSLLPDGGLFIWRSLDGNAVRTAYNITGERQLVYGDSSITNLGEGEIQVDIPPNQLGIVEYLTSVQQLKTALDLSGETEIAQEETMLTAPYIALSRLYSHGLFVKGKKLEPTREMVEILGAKSLTKIAEAGQRYVSLIEAIESSFTHVRHSMLIPEYQRIAVIQKDERYAAVGTEPVYYKFETAYLGYFTALFIERSKTDQYLLERDVIRDADIGDVHTSLAFASLLGIDVFVVDSDLHLLESAAGPITNAVEGRTDGPCCVVVSDDQGYYMRPFSSGLPLALSGDASVSGYRRHASDDFYRSTVESIGPPDQTGQLLTTNKKIYTSVLDRIAYIEDAPPEVRLLSLANSLLNRSAVKCTEMDLESCGIGGDEQALIRFVNRKMEDLIISR